MTPREKPVATSASRGCRPVLCAGRHNFRAGSIARKRRKKGGPKPACGTAQKCDYAFGAASEVDGNAARARPLQATNNNILSDNPQFQRKPRRARPAAPQRKIPNAFLELYASEF
jgi:hypothetical protein